MATRIFNFTVTGQRIRLGAEESRPVGDSQNYLKAFFETDDIWNGLAIEAVFSSNDQTYVKLVEPDGVMFPSELLKAPNDRIYVGLIGRGVNGFRITTNFACVDIDKSCYSEGGQHEAPAQDVYQELLLSVKTAVDVANSVREDADNGAFNGAQGIQGIQGVQGERGYSGLLPYTDLDMFCVGSYVPPSIFELVAPNKMVRYHNLNTGLELDFAPAIEGYDNEWNFTVTQGDVEYEIILPEISWGFGIAPTFKANTDTVCRIYKVGDKLCGEWVEV